MLFINDKYLLYTYYPTAESRSDSHITSFLCVTPSPSQSTVEPSHTNNAIVLIIAVCVSAGFLLILLVIILVTTVLLLKRVINKQKRGIITSVVYLIFIVLNYLHLHFQMMPQSQIIFLLMIILFTSQ